MEQLQKMGIQIGFLISGLFGAILMATKNAKTDAKSVILSLIGGMSAANYLTPVLVELLNIMIKTMSTRLEDQADILKKKYLKE